MARLAERDGWVCQICGKPLPKRYEDQAPDSPTVDHIIPLSRGGRGMLENLQLAHKRCNEIKGCSTHFRPARKSRIQITVEEEAA